MEVVQELKTRWGDGRTHTSEECKEWRRVLGIKIAEITEDLTRTRNDKTYSEEYGYYGKISDKELYVLGFAIMELRYWSRNITQTESEREAGLRKEVQELYNDINWRGVMGSEYKYWMQVLDARPGAAAHPRFVTAKLSPALRTLARAVDVMLGSSPSRNTRAVFRDVLYKP